MQNKSVKSTSVPQHVLLRLAGRALKVVARHQDKHGAIAAYAASLPELHGRYAALYAKTRGGKPSRVREMAESRQAVVALQDQLKAWAGPLTHDLPGLELAPTIGADVPDDMLHGVDRLLADIADHGNLPYQDQVVADLTEARDTLARERAEVQDILAGTQEEQAEVRKLAAEVQTMLVGLRRTLRVVLGRGHRDYRKLKAQYGRTLDEEDVEVEQGEGEAGDPVVPPRGGDVDVVEVQRDGEDEDGGDDTDGEGVAA